MVTQNTADQITSQSKLEIFRGDEAEISLPAAPKGVYLPKIVPITQDARETKLKIANLCRRHADRIRAIVIKSDPEFASFTVEGPQLISRLIANSVVEGEVISSKELFEQTIAQKALKHFVSEVELEREGLIISTGNEYKASDKVKDLKKRTPRKGAFSAAQYGIL